MHETPLKLQYVQYGCGLCAPADWTNFDVSPILRWQKLPLVGHLAGRFGPRFPPNVRYGDIVRGLPLADCSCRAVYCSHVLEHLALDDFRTALRNTYRILVSGGVFRFVVPDLHQLTRSYLESEAERPAHDFMHDTGLGQTQRPRTPMSYLREFLGNSRHRWLWDERTLTAELSDAGFVNIRRAQFGDAKDGVFQSVEASERWANCLGIECMRP